MAEDVGQFGVQNVVMSDFQKKAFHIIFQSFGMIIKIVERYFLN